MCDYLMGCKGAALDLLIFECGWTLQLYLSVQFRPLASVHKFEQLIKSMKISCYLWIVTYCTTNVVHLPVLVHSVDRRQK